MTGEKSYQISSSDAVFCRMGAKAERDGIVFSVAVPDKEPVSLILYRKGTAEVLAELPFPEQTYSGMVRTMKVKGITSRECEYNFRIGKKVVQDPAARLVVGRNTFGVPVCAGEHQIRCGFPADRFDWKNDTKPLQIPFEDGILYQLHVRGYTKQKNSGVRHKGTFLGLQEKIPYLKDLGVNQVLLMPAYEFDEIQEKTGIGALPAKEEEPKDTKVNYWGYVPGCYFAPKFSYSASGRPDVEFKTMVRTFHENGMEVLMEFAFSDSVDPDLVSACLIWWVQEYHVDGFRLLMNQEGANSLARNPFLMNVKLISSYFPTEVIYPRGRKLSFRHLAECNDGFKVNARKLLKGDEDQLSDFVTHVKHNPADSGVINYITEHDGFTLMDLVSYDRKHNEENGEQGRDGASCDYSWNCGVEGPTKRRIITRLRMRQMKNAFAMLLLSQGTPLILAGDEFGNSQMGNNNPYCHDSELTWVDWSREKSYRELTDFVKNLIAFRKAHGIMHMEKELTGTDQLSYGYPDFSCHGTRAWYGELEYQNRHVGLMYCGMFAKQDEFIYVAYNFHWEPKELALPNLPEGMKWSVVLSTAPEETVPGQQDGETGEIQREIQVPGRSVSVLLTVRTEQKKEKKKDGVAGKNGRQADDRKKKRSEKRSEKRTADPGEGNGSFPDDHQP